MLLKEWWVLILVYRISKIWIDGMIHNKKWNKKTYYCPSPTLKKESSNKSCQYCIKRPSSTLHLQIFH
jgi:hypothetical protein